MTCSRSLTREIFPNAPQPWPDLVDALDTVYTEDGALSIVKEYLTRSSSASFLLLLFRCEFVGTFHTAACNSFRIARAEVNATKCYQNDTPFLIQFAGIRTQYTNTLWHIQLLFRVYARKWIFFCVY